MAFKLSFATLLIGSLLLPGILWAEKSEDSRDDALMTVQSGGPVRYSTLSNAELFAAEREMREKIGKDPSNARYYFMLSDICTVLFDRTRKQKGIQSDEWLFKSADALEKVVMIDPSNKTAHYNLGVVYKRQGKMERAREELKKTIRLCDPKRDGYILLACWMEIGSIYMEQGFVEEAKEAFLKAREYDFGNPDVQAALQEIQSRKQQENGGSSGSFINPVSSLMGTNPASSPSAAMDPNRNDGTQQNQGIAQAVPALGQMLMQKFGGGQKSGQDNE